MEGWVKLLVIIFVLEVVLIAGFLLYKKTSKKKVEIQVSEAEIMQIDKEVRNFIAEWRRSEFKRIK